VLSIVLGLREVSAITHLTYLESAQVQLALFGFIGMVLFGSLFYIIPRMMQSEWPSPKRVRFHFWSSAAGIGLVFAGLGLGGLVQGFGINNPDPAATFITVVKSTIPFVGIATLGQLLLLAGQGALLWDFILLLCEYTEPVRKSALDLVMRGGLEKEGVRP